MEKRVIHQIIVVLLVVLVASTVVMIYLSNLKSLAFDMDFYANQYQKRDIASRFNSSVNLTAETDNLITYLEEGEGAIGGDFFNEREKTHLVEVRGIFRTLGMVLNVAVALSMISLLLLIFSVKRFAAHLTDAYSREYFRRLVSNLLIGVGAVVDGVAVLCAVVAFTFSTSFILFHKLLFATDTWMLDPATDNLIRMFPEPFFFEIFLRIVLMSVVFATVLLVVGFVIRLGKPSFMRRD